MDLLQSVRKEGSRGGRTEFSWNDVQSDQHRENYLGHSLMAPVGRWQKGKDLNWYARGDDGKPELSEAEKRKDEIRKVKEREEDEMRKALGLPPIERAEANANLEALGTRKVDDEVLGRALKEVAREGQEEEGEGGRGLGFGQYGGRGNGEVKEVMKGSMPESRDGPNEKRERRRSRDRKDRSRSRDRRPRRDEGDKARRRSRDREKDRSRDRRRHRERSGSRSRSRDRKGHRPRREHDEADRGHRHHDRRSRSRDGERERRRPRTRSPDGRRERRRP